MKFIANNIFYSQSSHWNVYFSAKKIIRSIVRRSTTGWCSCRYITWQLKCHALIEKKTFNILWKFSASNRKRSFCFSQAESNSNFHHEQRQGMFVCTLLSCTRSSSLLFKILILWLMYQSLNSSGAHYVIRSRLSCFESEN